MNRRSSLKTTLRVINRLRVEALGLQPIETLPKGKIGESGLCPLANALNRRAEVDQDYLYFSNEASAKKAARLIRKGKDNCDVVIPATLGKFVEEFDDGAYPHLIRR
jgi:hypothetical protein